MARRKVRIRSILIQDGGQGDGIMATHGLQALIESGLPFLEEGATCYVRTVVEPLVRVMLPDLKVLNLSRSKHSPHPRYHIIGKTSLTTLFRNLFLKDFYINFSARRKRASYGYTQGGMARFLQAATDLFLASGRNWLRETPAYYGLKMWAPLAESWGMSEVDLARWLYRAFSTLSEKLKAHASGLVRAVDTAPIAIFPGGKSFQYIPPSFLREVISRLGLRGSEYACYFAPDDRSIEGYRRAGINCSVTQGVEDILRVVAGAEVTITADSFVSHIAQMLSPRHVALLSHDLPQHTIHPAAGSIVVFEPLECCPCNYTGREMAGTCAGGYEACRVFESKTYLEAVVRAVEGGRG